MIPNIITECQRRVTTAAERRHHRQTAAAEECTRQQQLKHHDRVPVVCDEACDEGAHMCCFAKASRGQSLSLPVAVADYCSY
jgi:hydrogenase maturation factor HypF (carbamoyltransferase family)